jgi:hypothetical protein
MTGRAGEPMAWAPAAPIPRRLHQIWLGPRPVPERWARAWARRHRSWEQTVWREADIEPILPDGLRRAWTYYLERSTWHGAADVARIAILRTHGGVYADIDSEPVRSFEQAPFMGGTFFVGLELGTPEQPIHITNGVIGSVVGHPILDDVVERISRAEDLRSPWRTVGGGFLTEAVLANRHLPGVAILPIRTFYPEDKHGQPAPGSDTIYTRQYWATTHKLYDHVDEGWRTLAKRRRGEPIPPPVRERVLAAVRRAIGPGSGLRRVFRAVVPAPLRRLARASLRSRRPER